MDDSVHLVDIGENPKMSWLLCFCGILHDCIPVLITCCLLGTCNSIIHMHGFSDSQDVGDVGVCAPISCSTNDLMAIFKAGDYKAMAV